MIRIVLLSAILFNLYGCNRHDHSGNADDKATADLNVVEKYRQALETKDVATMDSLLADNYMGYGPSIGDSTTKEQSMMNWKNVVSELYESITYTRSESYPIHVATGQAAGDWVANWAYLTIKYKDGRGPVNLWANAIYKIENGKIIRSRTFYNEADVLRQLGYVMVNSKTQATAQ
jgi:hypothetical protein